jgi:hypothetical protein
MADHQNHHGTEQIQPGHDGLGLKVHFDKLADLGAFFGQKVHQQENRAVVENGGDRSGLADGEVGDAQHLGHQEGAGAHDGRHDLAAGGSCRLDGAGLLGRVADLLHHGDGHDAGTGHIGGRGTGDHAHKSAGHNGGLGGARVIVGLGTEFHADVNEHLAAAAGPEQRAENHNPVHESGAGTRGGSVDALAAHGHQVAEFFYVDTAVVKNAGLPFGGPYIGNKNADENRKAQTDGTIDAQQNHDQNRDAFKNINGQNRVQIIDPEAQPLILADGVPDVIKGGAVDEPVADSVKGMARLAGVFAGVEQEAQQADAGHMDRANQHGHHGIDKGAVELEAEVEKRNPDAGGLPGRRFDQRLFESVALTLFLTSVSLISSISFQSVWEINVQSFMRGTIKAFSHAGGAKNPANKQLQNHRVPRCAPQPMGEKRRGRAGRPTPGKILQRVITLLRRCSCRWHPERRCPGSRPWRRDAWERPWSWHPPCPCR